MTTDNISLDKKHPSLTIIIFTEVLQPSFQDKYYMNVSSKKIKSLFSLLLYLYTKAFSNTYEIATLTETIGLTQL